MSKKRKNHKARLLKGIVLIVLLLTICFFRTRNTIESLKKEIEVKQIQIETLLQKRNELVKKIMVTVKEDTNYEGTIFTEIDNEMQKLLESIESGKVEKIKETDDTFSFTVGRLFVILERYPDLKSSKKFSTLQDELSEIEKEITEEKEYYNKEVKKYNKKVLILPTSIIAKMTGYTYKRYF